MDRTEDGCQLRLLVVIDEYTRECLALEVGRSFTARNVMPTLQVTTPGQKSPHPPQGAPAGSSPPPDRGP